MTAAQGTVLDRLLPPEAEAPTDPSRTWLRDHGLPTRRDEAWKYTALDDLLGRAWVPASPTDRPAPELDLDVLVGRHGGPRIVFVDGAPVVGPSDLDDLPPGVLVTIDERQASMRRGQRYDGFQALNDAAGRHAAVIRVAAGAHVDVPIHVVHLSLGGDGATASHPRTIVEVGAGARATIVESYAGTAGASLANAVTSVVVGRDGHLDHHRVLAGPPGSMHVGHTAVDQAAGSRVHSWSLLAGSAIARNAVDVVQQGEGAEVDLQGLHVATGTQRHDTVVTVEHASSRGTSRQRFQGVVDDRARGSFSGRVIVGHDTVGNDAGQINRNLLLAPTAEADSRPWLEIFAADVRCTHGATVGRLDDDAMFFLRARGIPRQQARAMLVEGFVAELVEVVEPASLRSFVEGVVASAAERGDG